jgi:hypothetical protein
VSTEGASAKSGGTKRTSDENGSVDVPVGSARTEQAAAEKTPRATLSALEHADVFASRHIGPRPDDQDRMLAFVGFTSLEELAAAAVRLIIPRRSTCRRPRRRRKRWPSCGPRPAATARWCR